ncbi:MAG: DUF1800 domain-containing protein [Acetobacteraceae bacterium]|nr:DUF1800 domain-containing protein [Acetobacteraceae bacterium]
MSVRAIHAMNRFGLGRRGDEAPPGDPAAWLAAQLEGPDPALALPARTLAEGLVAWRDDLRRGNDGISAARGILREDTATLLDHAATTAAPFRERLVWFWANHFTVSIRRGGVAAVANAYLREAIRPHVTGRFADMLGAVMRHPAMLYYLDNAQSIGPDSVAARASGRGGLNENLARECLELHTVTPAAGYGQADVTALARLLTGWSVALRQDPPRALFRPRAHAPGAKVVMGQTYPQGPAALDAVLGWLARHPATLHNLAGKLVRHFVADDPPAAAVARVAAVLRESDGDLKAAALAVTRLDEAWVPLAKLRSPAEYVLAVVRAMDLAPGSRPQLRGAMAALGQAVMNAPLPNGWPDTAADWASPEAMMRRIDWAYGVAGRGGGLDAMAVGARALGPLLGAATRDAMARAGSRRDALALLFTAPEFQRR